MLNLPGGLVILVTSVSDLPLPRQLAFGRDPGRGDAFDLRNMVVQFFKPAGGILGGLGGSRHPIVVGLELLGGLSPLCVILVVFANNAGQEWPGLRIPGLSVTTIPDPAHPAGFRQDLCEGGNAPQYQRVHHASLPVIQGGEQGLVNMLVEEFFETLFGVAAGVAAVTRNGKLGPGGFQPLLQQSNILSPQGEVHGHLRTDVAAQGFLNLKSAEIGINAIMDDVKSINGSKIDKNRKLIDIELEFFNSEGKFKKRIFFEGKIYDKS